MGSKAAAIATQKAAYLSIPSKPTFAIAMTLLKNKLELFHCIAEKGKHDELLKTSRLHCTANLQSLVVEVLRIYHILLLCCLFQISKFFKNIKKCSNSEFENLFLQWPATWYCLSTHFKALQMPEAEAVLHAVAFTCQGKCNKQMKLCHANQVMILVTSVACTWTTHSVSISLFALLDRKVFCFTGDFFNAMGKAMTFGFHFAMLSLMELGSTMHDPIVVALVVACSHDSMAWNESLLVCGTGTVVAHSGSKRNIQFLFTLIHIICIMHLNIGGNEDHLSNQSPVV